MNCAKSRNTHATASEWMKLCKTQVIPNKCKEEVAMKTSIIAHERLRSALWIQVTGRSWVFEILKQGALFHKH
jgi:hypothetical protein